MNINGGAERVCSVARHWALLGLTLVAVGAAETRFLEAEFIVNDPAGSDSFPRSDSHADGTSVVVWRCTQPSPDVCARRLSLTGRPIGEEFIVNQARDGVQQAADVAIDAAGNFFVVWESNAGEDGDSFTVAGRLFDRHGAPLGDQRVLNTITEGRQSDPEVAWLPGHGWVVVWDSSHAFPNRIMARRFDASGAPIGSDQWVSRNPLGINIESGGNVNASVDADAEGNYVIAWEGPRIFEIIGGSEVFGRRFDSSGQPRGRSFRVVTQAEFQKGDPSVGVGDDGRFVIVFHRGNQTIAGRRYAASGAPTGAEFQLNQRTASTTEPAVVMLPDGGFLAGWTTGIGLIETGRFSVVARQFSAAGQPLEDERLVSRLASRPTMSRDASGDVLIALHSTGPNAGVRFAQTATGCVDRPTSVCVQGDRFKVEAGWQTAQSEAGFGTGERLTDETSTFWFFGPSNTELAVKTLDACGFTQTFWVFAAGATDVAVDLAVTDTEYGIRRRWDNPLGQPYETVRNSAAFECDPAAALEIVPPAASHAAAAASTTDAVGSVLAVRTEAEGPCVADAQTLCLSQGRFEVTVDYRDQAGPARGTAVPLSADSGYFWFFTAGNLEILVKVLDACGFTQRFWVLAAGLTDLEVDLRVRDTVTGQTRTYSNDAGQGFPAVIDTGAFATCDAG